MVARSQQYSITFWLFAAGFLTCTWDILFTLELGGFTLKAYQLCFLLAFASAFWERRASGLASFLEPLAQPFPLAMLCLAGFYVGFSPWSAFPLKSFLYSCWLIFDLLAVWLTVQHLSRVETALRLFQVAWIVMLFLASIILVDQVAYYFGYVGGLIGGNQDIRLKWGVSRPHALSFEPSFIASFLSIGLITTANQMFHSSRNKTLFWASLVTIISAVVCTTSRTGWINLILGFGLLAVLPLFVGKKFLLRPIAIFLGIVVLVAIVFYAVTPQRQLGAMNKSLVGSIARGDDGSGNARMRAFVLSYKFAKETNWLGTGFAASYRYYLDKGYEDDAAPGKFSERHYGNELIMSTWGQLLAEGGLAAILLYAIAGYFMCTSLFRRWQLDANGYAIGACAAAAVFFGFSALWIGNVCRGDVWVWYALWSAIAGKKTV